MQFGGCHMSGVIYFNGVVDFLRKGEGKELQTALIQMRLLIWV